MPKKIKNLFYKNLTFKKLLDAHYRARKNKAYKKDVILFEMNLENNIINLLNSIKNNNYKMGKYYDFKIFEPKERTIHSLPYRDRVVHQWYVEEFIKPYIVPKFINSSFACIIDRGTHKANNYIQHQMQIFKRNYGDFWVLKCDISKFFYSIDPNILFNILKKYIGEVSYYFEEEYREYVLNIIVEAKYRHLGKGKEALELLCQQAKENGLRFLCDDIETNNPAKNLFLDLGFKEVWARENITMLKKRL